MQNKDSLENFDSRDESFNVDSIDLKSLIFILLKYKFFITLFTSISLTLSIIYTFTKKPIWQGQFQIVLSSANQSIPFRGLLNSSSIPLNLLTNPRKNNLNTEIEILRSPSVLMPIFEEIKKIKLKNNKAPKDWNYNSWIKNNVIVELKKKTTVLNISYNDSEKELIIPTLNKIANTYKKYSGKNKKDAIKNGIQSNIEQLEIYKNKLIESTKDVQEFSDKYNLTGKYDDKSNQISTNVELTRREAINSINKVDFLLSQLNKTSNDSQEILNIVLNFPQDSIENSFSVIKKQINYITKLQEREDRLKSLYTDNDINIVAIQDRKNQAIKSLKRMALDYLNTSRLFQESKKNSVELPEGILNKFRELILQLNLDRNTFSSLENSLRNLNLESANAQEPWELITKPTLLDKPIAPNKKRIIFGGGLFGFLISIITSLLIVFFSKTIYDKKIINSLLKSPLLIDYSNGFYNEDEETLVNLLKSKLINPYLSDISFLIQGDIKEEKSSAFIIKLREILSKDQVKIISDLKDASNTKKIILILSLGDITVKQIKLISKNLLLKDKEILGWILI